MPVPEDEFPLRGELQQPAELYGALKMTGTAAPLRYGVLAALEEHVGLRGVDALGNDVSIRADGRDFGAMRLLYEHVGAARASLGYLGTAVKGPIFDAYAHGVDGKFTSGDGKWIGEGLLIATDRDDVRGNAATLDLQYAADSRYQHRVSLDWFDEDVNFNDLGFLARNDYRGAQYTFLYAQPNTGARVTDMRDAVIGNGKQNVSKHQFVATAIGYPSIRRCRITTSTSACSPCRHATAGRSRR